MKQTALKIMLSGTVVALALCSCTKQETDQIVSEEKVVISAEIEPGDKTSLDGTNVIWSAGDAVTIFSTSNNKKAFTLNSGAGSTSATFIGETPAGDSPYYLIYPHNSANSKSGGFNFIVSQNQTYVANSFGNGSFPMFGKFDSFSDPVGVKNLFGGIKLQFTGECTVSKIVLEDLSGKSLWGKANLSYSNPGTDKQTITFTDGGSSSNLLCPDGVKLDKTTPTAFFFAVPAGSFSSGFKATVYAGSTEMGSFSTTADKTIARNKVRVMKSLEVKGTGGPADLSATESANCYILYDGGQYKFKTVKGNGTDKLTVTGVEVLWETVNTTTAPAVGTIVKNPSYADDYITFTATGTPGNALIAAKNGDAIVWSWHIWVPSTKVTKAAYSNRKVAAMMDRNVGALVTTAGDTKSNGLLYQFGRKDPFMGSAVYSTANTPIASTCSTFPQEEITTSTNIDYVIARPTTFIKQGTGSDWLYSGSKDNWSSSAKTIYDPCPPGYRVSPNTAWDDIVTLAYADYCWTVEGIHNYPLTGRINGSNGKREGQSNSGYIWNRGAGTSQGQMLGLSDSQFNRKKTANRSFANAMRCCSDTAPSN